MSADRSHTFRIDPAELPGEAVIFGCTPAMGEVRSKIDSIVSCDLPVVIQGESGTGKEMIAKYLHSRSNRREAPFVRLSCAAIPANLLEIELFGYEEGSFKSAKEGRMGLVEIAEGGTLFLDEIDAMHLDLQDRLYELLENGAYTRVGSSEKRRGHVRVNCATNSDLEKVVENGTFRKDLYDRINRVSLRLSALRDRKSDIPLLCEYFLDKLARQFRRTAPQLNPATLQLLQEWDWPGNMRELENWVVRAIILGDDAAPGAELRRQAAVHSASYDEVRRGTPLKEIPRRATSAVTGTMILNVLQANHWDRRKTAEELHMGYRALLHKLREVGIPQRRRSHRGFPPAH